MPSASIKFLYHYAKPYRLKIFLAVIFMLLSSGLNVIPPYLFKYVVDDVLISRNIFMLNVICVCVCVYICKLFGGVLLDLSNYIYLDLARIF